MNSGEKERRDPLKRRRFLAALVLVAVGLGVAAGAATAKRSSSSLSGAGSSFVYPLVSLWVGSYKSASINYNPIGSGGGIAAISNRQVDFGASDAPLTPEQFGACHGCVQIPWALSATSVPYHVTGAPYGLKITGPVLADIYLGKITHWNDSRLQKLNKGVKLPSTKITPIYRSDGSGTTFNFTEYLSKVSPEFKRKVGNSTQVNFPTGIGAAKSVGVASALSRTEGGITYVDVAYSLKSHFKFFKVQNRAKKFTLPGIRGIQASAATVKRVPANNELSIVDPPKSQATAYPICTFSYVIVPLKTPKAAELKRFVNWAVTSGQKVSGAQKYLFVPVPKVVQAKAEATLRRLHT
jgi:phosphate transport system substrate-binding protein